jgi:hypothetical protein
MLGPKVLSNAGCHCQGSVYSLQAHNSHTVMVAMVVVLAVWAVQVVWVVQVDTRLQRCNKHYGDNCEGYDNPRGAVLDCTYRRFIQL